jgi:LysR family nod box-dependent transcriptional activator
VVLAGALQRIAHLAPDLTFEFLPVEDSPMGRLERGEADLWVTLDHAASPDHPSELLFEDDYVVVAWEGNSAIRDRLDKTLYFDLGHVSTRFGKTRQPAFEEWFLQSLQAKRRIEVVSPSFSMAPSFLVGTDRIATMHRRLAEIAVRSWPLRIYPTPMEIPPVRQVAQWNRSSATDPGLRWLISEIKAYVQTVSISDPVSLTTWPSALAAGSIKAARAGRSAGALREIR